MLTYKEREGDRERRGRRLLFRFPPGVAFPRVRTALGRVTTPPLAAPPEILAFVALELLANSFRAHLERGVRDFVVLEYRVDGDSFRVTVSDSGRGFNPKLLPYDLDAEPDDVDPTSRDFEDYRERYDNHRCGMGLLSAKRVFPDFEIRFVNREGYPVPWFSGSVLGTVVSGSIPLARGRARPRGSP